MWTSKNRGRYDRSALHPSDLTDDEWALIEPLIPPARRGGNKRHVDEREVMKAPRRTSSAGQHSCATWSIAASMACNSSSPMPAAV